jgi:hypothetical protein
VSSRNRQVGDHFSERDHDRVTDGTHEGVTEEETEGTTVCEGIPGTYKSACFLEDVGLVPESSLNITYLGRDRFR